MPKKSRSVLTGGLNPETTEPRQDLSSCNAESPSISDTLDTTAKVKSLNGFRPTQSVKVLNPNAFYANAVVVFADKLVKLGKAEWRTISLPNGGKGYALFFPLTNWIIDPITKEMTPL